MLRDAGHHATHQKFGDPAQSAVPHNDQAILFLFDQMQNPLCRITKFNFCFQWIGISRHFLFSLFQQGLSRLLDVVDIAGDEQGRSINAGMVLYG